MTAGTMEKPGNRVNEIDFLRIAAVSGVVFFHYTFRGFTASSMSVMPYPELSHVSKYGYLGVYLFFMISGFVILMTAAAGQFRKFVISRCVRLYPAFWICCTLTFILTVAAGAPRFHASFGQYAINLTLMSQFVGVPSIDGAYWSLFVEIQFYAIVAFIILIGQIARIQPLLFAWLLISTFAPLLSNGILERIFITSYAPFFMAGAAYYLIWRHGLSAARLFIVGGSWCLGVRELMNVQVKLEGIFQTAMDPFVTIGILTSFHLVFLLISLRKTGTFGAMRWTVAGAATYPLYLLHENIGFITFNLAWPAINRHILLWVTIAVMIVMAHAVHVAAERALLVPLRAALTSLFESGPVFICRRWLFQAMGRPGVGSAVGSAVGLAGDGSSPG